MFENNELKIGNNRLLVVAPQRKSFMKTKSESFH